MGKETGLTKREQQTARRKLLSLGVITIIQGGFRNTYHFKIIWEKLYQVIAGIKRPQTVATETTERAQTVPTEPEQNVSTAVIECQQNVSTRWKQNVGTQYRENNTENKEEEKTDRENQATWEKTIEQLKQDLPVGEAEARLTGTTLIDVTNSRALIFVPNRFNIAWLERRLYGQITKAIKGVVGRDVDLQFVTSPR
jgi:DnaA N-terminal domain